VTPPRTIVFISHARPDDDELTRWLCGRLTAHGYRVWADLEQLLGGDPFWSDIQRAIRNDAARFLVILTQTSIARTGVLNEIAEASDVSRTLGDPRFMIPIRGDSIPWSEFPIQLKQLNGLDFSSDWSKDFGTLLKTLEKSGIPRTAGDPEVARTAEFLVRGAQSVQRTPAVALLNRLNILSVPTTVRYFYTSLSAAHLSEIQPSVTVPCAAHDRLLVSFADLDTVRAAVPADVEVEERFALPLRSFLSGKSRTGPAVDRHQAHNYLSSMLRDSFESFLRRAGLVQFDRRWFVPKGWREDNQGRYQHADGKEHYRVLVGKAKDLTWHFAVSFKVYASAPRRIQVLPHVLFSPDGIAPLLDQKQLRRRHCKLWWNDKWRDLLLALCAELFGKATKRCPVALGGAARMLIETFPVQIQLPVSYTANNAYLPEDVDDAPEWEESEDRDSEEEVAE
jgi:hypothetical protein